MADQSLVLVGALLIIAGFVLAFLAVMAPALRGAKSEGGAVIIIGPFPVMFGTSSRAAAKSILILAILLFAILLAFFLAQWLFVSAS